MKTRAISGKIFQVKAAPASFDANHSEGVRTFSKLEVSKGDGCDFTLPQFGKVVKIDVKGFEAIVFPRLSETLFKTKSTIMTVVIESSWKTFTNYGGHEAVLKHPFSVLEICRRKRAPLLFSDWNVRVKTD